jgi:isopenicillin N synthase-like dioxygenase
VIPLIDLGDLRSSDPAKRRALAAQIGRACREVGFFLISNHGIPSELLSRTFAQSARFFAQPVEFKAALSRAELGGNRGYVGLQVEALDERSGRRDEKEAFNVVFDGYGRPPKVWPPVVEPSESDSSSSGNGLADFQPTVQAYFDAALAVAQLLHRAFALDLGLDEHFFDDKIDKPQACLRLLHYPVSEPADSTAAAAAASSSNVAAASSSSAAAATAAPLLAAGEHCDYGNLTLLATDGVAGLQIRPRRMTSAEDKHDDGTSNNTARGEWIAAPHVSGTLVCNLGDCLQRWTNDVYLSTPHRVLAPERERFSIAFFCEPNPDALVDATQIQSCVPKGQKAKYAPITADAYLQSRFAATYGAKKES